MLYETTSKRKNQNFTTPVTYHAERGLIPNKTPTRCSNSDNYNVKLVMVIWYRKSQASGETTEW